MTIGCRKSRAESLPRRLRLLPRGNSGIGRRGLEPESQLSVDTRDEDLAAVLELAEEKLVAERPLHLFLDDPRKRACAKIRVVAFLGEIRARGRVEHDLDFAIREL